MISTIVPVEGETLREFEIRVCKLREEYCLSWQDVADTINAYSVEKRSANAYRKRYARVHHIDADSLAPTNITMFTDLLSTIKKEKVKLSDERAQLNAYIRLAAREETLKEIALDVADKISKVKVLPKYKQLSANNSKIASLLISDWHYGLEVNLFNNKYSPEVTKERVAKLRDEVIQRCEKEDITTLNVVNLSDLIAGRIHSQIRIQSRVDTITQVIEVSEILAEFLTDLSKHFTIHYYDALDNHSRLEPNKKESIDLESLVRIVTWYLQSRLSDNESIIIHLNELGADIINFKIFDFEVIGVHGDKDKFANVTDHLSQYIKKKLDAVFIAHTHHFAADERNSCVVVNNGSLMGVDDYAHDLRLDSYATQVLVISTPANVVDNIHRIILN